MKVKSILRKTSLVLFSLLVLSCSNETLGDLNENSLANNESLSKKVVNFLTHYEDCFTLVIEEEEETEVIIDEETGEVITTDENASENEDSEDFDTIDLSETPFPITVILSGETEETMIFSVEELLNILENCNKDTHKCNKKHGDKYKDESEISTTSSSELNAEILSDLADCFTVVIEENETAAKNRKKTNKYKSIKFSDLEYPITIQIDEETETLTIEDAQSLKELIKNCSSHKKGCNNHDEEETTDEGGGNDDEQTLEEELAS